MIRSALTWRSKRIESIPRPTNVATRLASLIIRFARLGAVVDFRRKPGVSANSTESREGEPWRLAKDTRLRHTSAKAGSSSIRPFLTLK